MGDVTVPAYIVSVVGAAMMLVKTALWLRGANGKNGHGKNGPPESATDTARLRGESSQRMADKLEQMRSDIIEAHNQTRSDIRNMITVATLKSTEDVRYHIDMYMRQQEKK